MKKGMTLVELLAVILILGMLAGLAVLAYNSIVNTSKDQMYEQAEESMISAAVNMYTSCQTNITGVPLYCSTINKVDEDGNTKIILDLMIDYKFLTDIKDPYDTTKKCSPTSSYVQRTKDTSSTSIPKYNYSVCLVCSNYSSEACS